ncbi:Tartrate-resistant acid phosphatase type 5 [Aphelenchoides bicaudatus]|nr:Tartrate-resistant acid phosphatase type 5 [Aphelenchoides bicaudatus]
MSKWTFVFFSFLHVTCLALTADERLLCTRGVVCTIKKDTLDFFVVGDTGGRAVKHSKKLQSEPTETQLDVAASMVRQATKKPIDFVVNVGDNIYANGVSAVNDTRFKTVFEDPYSDKSLQVPWYLIAGNHDHVGNVPPQFEYTNKSNIWTFPYYFYKASYAFGAKNTKVDFIYIDTIVLCGNTVDEKGNSATVAEDDVPDNPERNFIMLAKKQWKWTEDQLKASKADYLFVVGHYPIYTISGKQTIKCLHKRLDPLLQKYKANAYLSGHHHTLQYFYDNGKKSGAELHYIISGAGSRINNNRKKKGDVGNVKLFFRYPLISEPKYTTGSGSGGFVSFSIGATEGSFNFYGNGTSPLYQATIRPRQLK